MNERNLIEFKIFFFMIWVLMWTYVIVQSQTKKSSFLSIMPLLLELQHFMCTLKIHLLNQWHVYTHIKSMHSECCAKITSKLVNDHVWKKSFENINEMKSRVNFALSDIICSPIALSLKWIRLVVYRKREKNYLHKSFIQLDFIVNLA